jgi:hypothetical protein
LPADIKSPYVGGSSIFDDLEGAVIDAIIQLREKE